MDETTHVTGRINIIIFELVGSEESLSVGRASKKIHKNFGLRDLPALVQNMLFYIQTALAKVEYVQI